MRVCAPTETSHPRDQDGSSGSGALHPPANVLGSVRSAGTGRLKTQLSITTALIFSHHEAVATGQEFGSDRVHVLLLMNLKNSDSVSFKSKFFDFP